MERQLPHELVGGRCCRLDLFDHRGVVADDRGEVGAERTHRRTCERGDVDDAVVPVLAGENERVGHDHAAFGVGVDHLHRRATADGDHIAEPGRRARGHVVGAHQVAGDLGGAPERRQRRDRGERCSRAGHVVLHLGMHPVRRLEADAARVVHHALGDDRQPTARFASRAVRELDHSRRLCAPGVDRQQATDAHLDERLLVEHFHGDPVCGAEGDCEVGERHRAQVTVRGVGEVTGEHRRRREDVAARRSGLGELLLSRRGDDRGTSQGDIGRLGAQCVVAIAGEQDPLHRRVGGRGCLDIRWEHEGELVASGRGASDVGRSVAQVGDRRLFEADRNRHLAVGGAVDVTVRGATGEADRVELGAGQAELRRRIAGRADDEAGDGPRRDRCRDGDVDRRCARWRCVEVVGPHGVLL